MSGEDEDGFLSRWSRRKAAARAPEPVAPPEAPADAHPEDAVDEAYVAALPPVDSITAATDLAPFLRRGVPAVLRNAALRRMWSADPLIRDHLDVARDYYWDWNAPGGVPGGGGSLSPESVAKMARGIRGLPEPEPEGTAGADPDTAVPASAGPGTVAEGPGGNDRPLPDDPIHAEDRPPARALPEDGPEPTVPPQENAVPGPSAGLRKKHGGAVPE